jgi:Na+-transporting methylmalonyl-CoA/oxaloacetate decarboxylase gamma subunit
MENLAFGLQISVVGMGIVFGLLAVLRLLLSLVLRFERRGEALAPAAEPTAGEAGAAVAVGTTTTGPAPAPAGPVRLVGAPAGLDPRLVAAVTVAVLRHAETRRRQAAPAMRSYWPGSLLFASRWVAAGRMRQGQIWRRRAR